LFVPVVRLPLGREAVLWCALCETFVPCTVDAKRVVVLPFGAT
jgi:hypothetical protein